LGWGDPKLTRPNAGDYGRARLRCCRVTACAASARVRPGACPSGAHASARPAAHCAGVAPRVAAHCAGAVPRGAGRRGGPVGPTAAAVSLIFGAGATPRWLNLGRRDDARATEVTTAHAHVAPAIVVHGPLAHPRDEGVRRLAVLEDEPGLGSVGAREDYPR